MQFLLHCIFIETQAFLQLRTIEQLGYVATLGYDRAVSGAYSVYVTVQVRREKWAFCTFFYALVSRNGHISDLKNICYGFSTSILS
jgi:hypothetical protein